MSTATAWHKGEPPKDGREYVALGNISWTCRDGGHGSVPFTESIHWNGEMWLRPSGMSVVLNCDDQFHIHHWAFPPNVDQHDQQPTTEDER